MPDYLIAYDITDPKRLARMHRYLRKIAVPIQYSVFYLIADERHLDALLADAASLIDPKSDDLRCYPLPARGLRFRIGRATLPAGIQWSGLPARWLEEYSLASAGKVRHWAFQQPDLSHKIDGAL